MPALELRFGLEHCEVSHLQKPAEIRELGCVRFRRGAHGKHKLREHALQLQLGLVVVGFRGQQLARHVLVELKALGFWQHAVLGQHSRCALAAAALRLHLGVHVGVLAHRLRALLRCQLVHLVPLPLAHVQVERRARVPGGGELVRLARLGEVLGVLLLHVAAELRLVLPDLARLVPHVGLRVDVHRLAEGVDAHVHLRRLGVAADVYKARGHRGHHLRAAAAAVVHGHVHRVLPRLLQRIHVPSHLLGHLVKADVNRLRVLSLFLQQLVARHNGLHASPAARVARHARRQLHVDLLHLGWHVVLRHANSVLPLARLLVHLDGQLRPLRLQELRLGVGVVLALDVQPRLRHLHVAHAARVVLLRHAHGRGPVLLVDVHVDGLLGLVSLDELVLRLLEPPLVLQVHRVLEVHLRQLLLHGRARELKGVHERSRLHSVVDGLLDEPKLGEQRGARLAPKAHRPRVRHLLGGVGPAVRARDADGVVPHLVRAVHLHRRLPVLGLEEVLLSLLEV
mmetsp:Transcript_12166/g.23126  ORF Transcript_12166/g.23126 Transcript_12166/m.23126 type:complete len:511 (-) Transcript_12166:2571-4103(-)